MCISWVREHFFCVWPILSDFVSFLIVSFFRGCVFLAEGSVFVVFAACLFLLSMLCPWLRVYFCACAFARFYCRMFVSLPLSFHFPWSYVCLLCYCSMLFRVCTLLIFIVACLFRCRFIVRGRMFVFFAVVVCFLCLCFCPFIVACLLNFRKYR